MMSNLEIEVCLGLRNIYRWIKKKFQPDVTCKPYVNCKIEGSNGLGITGYRVSANHGIEIEFKPIREGIISLACEICLSRLINKPINKCRMEVILEESKENTDDIWLRIFNKRGAVSAKINRQDLELCLNDFREKFIIPMLKIHMDYLNFIKLKEKKIRMGRKLQCKFQPWMRRFN